jgi:DNA-binding Lrp family transcriptional regulator
MDLRDFQILLELQRNPFTSIEGLGRSLRISAPAVTARLKGLQARGVLLGLALLPRPQSLGRHWHIFAYSNVNSKVDVQRVLEAPDVVSVWRGASGEMMVNTFDRDRDATPPRELTALLGSKPVGVVSLDPPGERVGPGAELSSLDWRVIEALLPDPRVSLRELARRTGLSERTVRRRREFLWTGQHVMVLPIIDTTQEPGLIVYAGYLAVKRLEDLDTISVPGLVIFRRLYHPPAAWFMGHAATFAELQAVERKLRGHPGVMGVDLGPTRAASMAHGRLHRWVRAEVRRWERFRPTSRTRRGTHGVASDAGARP